MKKVYRKFTNLTENLTNGCKIYNSKSLAARGL